MHYTLVSHKYILQTTARRPSALFTPSLRRLTHVHIRSGTFWYTGQILARCPSLWHQWLTRWPRDLNLGLLTKVLHLNHWATLLFTGNKMLSFILLLSADLRYENRLAIQTITLHHHHIICGMHFTDIIITISCRHCCIIHNHVRDTLRKKTHRNSSILWHWFQEISQNQFLDVFHRRHVWVVFKFRRPDRRRMGVGERHVGGWTCTRQGVWLWHSRGQSSSGSVTSGGNWTAAVSHSCSHCDKETAQVRQSRRSTGW